jgi:competence protein ComEA
MNKLIKDYLSFSRKDRIGILSLIVLILLVYFLPFFFSKSSQTIPIRKVSVLAKAVDSIASKQKADSVKRYNTENEYFHQEASNKANGYGNGKLFQFDPNTIKSEDWRRLGLNDKTIKIISNYINKGGKFYKPEDLQKIWGMPQGFYERVKNYVVIPSFQSDNQRLVGKKPETKLIPFNVNEADTTTFIALPGIGSKLAIRIINFREKLGGFYSINQIGETYGLSDSTFQKLKPYFLADGKVKKLNINTATAEELKSHPYIKWNLANAIVAYRSQHGNFTSLEELKNIVLVNTEWYDKTVPYLTLE